MFPETSQHIVLDGDTARARLTDPLSSHVAAEKSAETRGQVHEAIVVQIREHGPMNGRELNDRYETFRRAHGWPVVSYDSPRKRAGELVGSRLVVVNPDDPRGTPHIYALRGDA